MKIDKITSENGFDFSVELNSGTHFFTRSALEELRTKISEALIMHPKEVKPQEALLSDDFKWKCVKLDTEINAFNTVEYKYKFRPDNHPNAHVIDFQGSTDDPSKIDREKLYTERELIEIFYPSAEPWGACNIHPENIEEND